MERSYAPIFKADSEAAELSRTECISTSIAFCRDFSGRKGWQASGYPFFFHPDSTHRCAISGKKLSISSDTRFITASARL